MPGLPASLLPLVDLEAADVVTAPRHAGLELGQALLLLGLALRLGLLDQTKLAGEREHIAPRQPALDVPLARSFERERGAAQLAQE